MDVIDSIIEEEVIHQIVAPNSREEGLIMEKLNAAYDSTTQNEGSNGCTEIVDLAAESTTVDSSAKKDGEGSTLHEELSGLNLHKESKVEGKINTNNSKKGQGRGGSTEKVSNPKNLATMAKKNKDGKTGVVTSKQPLASATNRRPSNDRQISGSITSVDSGRATKSAAAHLSQQTKMPCTGSPITGTTESKGLREVARHLKPLKQGQGPEAKVEESTHSSLSPVEGGNKPQRTGGLPSYGFSFKCDERAQKRKEFYEKLEEKIHAKEVEKTTIQAKSQESQEAEVKMLRKSLKFKATPMPSFYREPAPPKMELKKIPTTRPKSPKLGRPQSSRIKDSGGNSSDSPQSGRLSLDEKSTRHRIAKGSSTQQYKKPLRRSVPKLPSQKTTLANAAEDSASLSQQSEQSTLDPEAEQTYEPSQTAIAAEPVVEDGEGSSLEKPESKSTISELSTEEHSI